MALNYKNPLSDRQLNATNSVERTDFFGTNFSVLQAGGFMEVYTLDDLLFNTGTTTGPVELSANTIPIQYSVRIIPQLNDSITLASDNFTSGRRRPGMLVYVHETDTVYQYTIPNYDTLWDNAQDAIDSQDDYTTVINTSTTGGTDFINAWLDNTIEGVS